MTKKVIAIYGVADVGKSTSIKLAYDLLKSKYKEATVDELFVGADIKVVLTVNGTKIGIESQGDPGGRLKDSLSLFVKMGCHIIICATRSRGQTVQAVEALASAYEILWLEQVAKKTTAEQQNSNMLMARKIVKEVESVLGA